MYHRTAVILISLVLGLNSGCSSADPDKTRGLGQLPTMEVPSEWVRFEVGPYSVLGPPDMEMKRWQGEDASGYTLENSELSLDVDISIYNTGEEQVRSYVQENGNIWIEGKLIKITKIDLNRPAPGSAVNADGSRAKPVEKNIVFSVRFPDKGEIVTVGFSEETSSPFAVAMLQSMRRK